MGTTNAAGSARGGANMKLRHRLASKPAALLALAVVGLVAYRRTNATDDVEDVPIAEESNRDIDLGTIEEDL